MTNKNNGFTIVELIVVLIIVGVLASIAVPMMSGNLDRAMKTEAIMALSAIRTAERAYYITNGAYAPVDNFSNVNQLNIPSDDLNGAYFSSNCYMVSAGSSVLSIFCDPSQSANPKVRHIQAFYMDQDGNIYDFGPVIPGPVGP